jgi:hypothetical protein
MKLSHASIRTDGGTQTRVALNEETVAEYAAAMEEGAQFPPVVAFYDGTAYWLADGFHRIAAEKRVGWTETVADVRQGTRRDAVLYSVGANGDHGLRRTNADKRRAVETLLMDEEWVKESDNWIAGKCGVSQPFVGSLRSRLITVISQTRTGADGRTINTANIGKKPLTCQPNMPADGPEHTGRTDAPPKPRRTNNMMSKTDGPPSLDDADPAFKEAWDAMFREVKNAKKLKWRTVSFESARHHIQILLDVITC